MTIQALSSPSSAPLTSLPASGSAGAPTQQAGATTQTAGTSQSASATSSKTSASTSSYTVSISNAAHAALAEATETSVQTAQEANSGDHQAQRLLAKEQANRIR